MAIKKAADSKGKKKRTKHEKVKKGEEYKIEGAQLKRLNKNCPKCGPGVFMAEHDKRRSCGNCGYTEFK
ncbi:MAG TPA: 30S ribosomal protein S27ae [archaeon]|nr:30S ribosomal protein S27ae [archaeon]